MQNKFWILVKDGNGKPIIRDLDRLCLDYEPEPENGEEFIKVVEASALESANAEIKKLRAALEKIQWLGNESRKHSLPDLVMYRCPACNSAEIASEALEVVK